MTKIIKGIIIAMIASLFMGAMPLTNTMFRNIEIQTVAYASQDDVYQKLISLQSRFPDGKYYDHYVDRAGYDAYDQRDESYQDSVTDLPCNHNANAVGNYDCNYFDGGSQCWAFGRKLFYEVFGIRASAMPMMTDGNISIGDYVRLYSSGEGGHSGVVLSIDGNTFTMAEANIDYYGKIGWGKITYIKSSIAYYQHASNYDSINVSTNHDISLATITPISDRAYTGKAIKPEPTIVDISYTLIKDKDFAVEYKNNVKVGIATVTLTGIGDYYGTAETTFNIVPKKTKISKLTKGEKKITVSWVKNNNCDRYQIRYSTDSDFDDYNTRTISGKNNTKYIIKGLKSGKKYYISIRCCKTVGGSKYYSGWSATKSIKTKESFDTDENTHYGAIVAGRYAYVAVNGTLKQIDLKKTGSKAVKTLCKCNCISIDNMSVKNGYLYFVGVYWLSGPEDQDYLCRIKLSGGKVKRFGKCFEYKIEGNTLYREYWVSNESLYLCESKLNGSNAKTYYEGDESDDSSIDVDCKYWKANIKGYKVLHKKDGYPYYKIWLRTPKGRKYYIGRHCYNV